MEEDYTTKNLSLSLYHYLCQNLVGYEDHVKTIRMMNNVRDNLSHNLLFVWITSGSFGEGIEMKGSDIDIMNVLKFVEVHESISSVVMDISKTYFSINMEDTKPGFTYLSLEFPKSIFYRQMCKEVRQKLFLSNTLFKQNLISPILPIVHGPCLSDTRGVLDYALCLHSKSWKTPSNQWITRPNNSWPKAEVKQNIMDHGVLFVPIGVKGSENEEIEWRLSFSVGEKLLIYTFSHSQLLCYVLLKILLKDIISMDKQCKDLLCSYFLKSILFWVSEELQPSVWTPKNLIECFMKCFRRLMYCVEYSVCPHYFIPEYNLFENKIEGKERQLLLNNLKTLHSYDWRCIFFSTKIPRFELSSYQNISFNAYAYSITQIVNSFNLFVLTYSNKQGFLKRTRAQVVYNLFRIKSTRIQLLNLYISDLREDISQTIPLTSRYGNKYQYKQDNTCLSYLLQNIHQDPVCGWLKLASFFYRRQQYNKALDMTAYSLSKCTLEKLCRSKYLSDNQIELLSLKTIKKKGIIRSLKMLEVKLCDFNANSSIIPKELQMEVDTMLYPIPAVVYAHFLRIVCHYHLKNIRQCRESIRDLQLTITEGYFIPNFCVWKAISYNCLGVALQLVDEPENAKQAFRKSIELFPDPNNNNSFKRLSLMSII